MNKATYNEVALFTGYLQFSCNLAYFGYRSVHQFGDASKTSPVS
jgi:hypothetical protein